MRRARIGLLTCSWSVLVFVMAIAALLVSSAGAFAQDQPANWSLADQQLKIAVHGSEKTISANAILAATDANGAIFSDKDGAIKVGDQFGKFLNKNIAAKPIMANIVPGAPLFMGAVIQGVSADYVSHIVSGRANMNVLDAVANEILNNVTAQFSKELFAMDVTGTVQSAWSVAGLHPNAVTGVGDLSTWGISNVMPKSATSVLVLWYYNDLVVGATNPEVAKNDTLQSKVFIAGAQKGTSNFVGVEIPGKTGPALYTNVSGKTISYLNAWDTTMIPYYAGSAGMIGLFGYNNPGVVTTVDLFASTTNNPLINPNFQFRSGDILEVTAVVQDRKEYDGEPSAYFSADGDALVLTSGTYAPFGSSSATQVKISNTSGEFVTTASMTADGSGNIFDMPGMNARFVQSVGGDTILYASGMINFDLLTIGEYQTFTMNFKIQDEFIQNATNQSMTAKVDTAPPYVSALTVTPDEVRPGTSSDTATLVALLDGTGENANVPGNWLNVGVAPIGFHYDFSAPGIWTTAPAVFLGSNASGMISSASVGQVVPKVNPTGSGQVVGTKLTINMDTNIATGALLNAGFILNVSDDARNPAMSYTDLLANNGVGSALIVTTTKFYSIADEPGGLYKLIGSATTSLDNVGPVVNNVRFGSTGLPSGFMTGDSQLVFDYLRNATETIDALVNADLHALGWTSQLVQGASRSLILSPRGTAKIDASGNGQGNNTGQNGSPVAAVVEFQLSPDPDDNDYYLTSVGNEFGFRFQAPEFTDWAALKPFVGDPSHGWVQQGAPAVSGNVGYVTFTYAGGLPKLATLASDDVSLNVTVNDDLNNNSAAQPSVPMMIDVNRPIASVVGDTSFLNALIVGNATPANTVMVVTDAINKTKSQVMGMTLPQISKTGALTSNLSANLPYINSYTPDMASVPTVNVKAGYMIIVAANYQEPYTEYNSILGTGGNEIFFPYLIKGDSVNKLDKANTLFGQQFKTIAADFSDFSAASSMVVPDITTVVSGNVDDAAEQAIVSATWYYFINPSDTSLVSSFNGIRSVTLTARDLSGNKTILGVRVGTADFAKTLPSVLAYRIYNDLAKNQGVIGAYVQGGTPSAFDISAATFNVEKTSVEVSVKIGNGSTGGGNYDVSDTTNRYPITADMTNLGGGKYQKPDSILIVKQGGGTSTNIADATAGSITYATFTFTSPAGEGAAVAAKKIAVYATAENLVASMVETSAIDVDRDKPGVQILSFGELNAVAGDNMNDLMVRPGQTVRMSALITGDYFTPLYGGATGDLLVRADGSKFGLGTAIEPTETLRSGNIVYATFDVTVNPDPSTIPNPNDGALIAWAQDAALNKTTSQTSPNYIIDTIPPSGDSIILSASNEISFVTNEIHPGDGQWYEVGTKHPNGSYTYNNAKQNAAVGIGDQVRVVARFKINDTILNQSLGKIFGNFELFNGASAVVPDATSALGEIVTATWTVTVTSSAPSNEVAYATLWAIDLANLRSLDVLTPNITVDTTVPSIVSENVTYRKQGPVVETDELGASSITQGVSTALTLTYKFEEGAYASGHRKRYPGGIIFANANTVRVANGLAVGADPSPANQILLVTPLISIDGSDFGLQNPFIPERWTLTGDGPEVDSASSFAKINESTNTILTIYAPTFRPFGAGVVAAKKNAAFKVVVKDHLGNALVSYPKPIEIDQEGPTIDSHTLAYVSGPMQPAYYAGATIVRPTRVGNGTVMAGEVNIKDNPDWADAIRIAFKAFEFNGGYQWLQLNPASADLQKVTYTFTVGNAASSFPPSGVNANGLDAGYAANGKAKVVAEASDTVNNASSKNSSPLYEIDNSGPHVIYHAFDATTEAKAKNLMYVPALPQNNIVNAIPASWLVWAATVVVDGTEEEHFQNFGLDWNTKVGSDYLDRLVPGSLSQGYKVLVASATRTVLFVTSTIQIAADAIPMDKVNVVAQMSDIFGNQTKVNNDVTSPNVQWIAINAIGPKATEVTLVVDGESEYTTLLNNLGIGRSVDSVTSSFEVGAGANLIVAATLTTVNSQLPAEVSLDLSQLFPAGMAQAVTRVIPSRAFITPQGNGYAEWNTIAYDFGGGNVGIANFDMAAHLATPVTMTLNQVKWYSGLVTAVTPSNTWVNPTILNQAKPSRDANFANSIANLSGLPFIEVQQGATPANIASVTVRVADNSTLFPAEFTASDQFTVDTLSPQVDYDYVVTNRAMPPSNIFVAGDRTGFPFAPNLEDYLPNTPNRVRGGDQLNVIGTIVNPLIDGSGDDYFRPMPDGQMFGISNPALSVNADLTAFNETVNQAVAVEDGNPYVLTYQSVPGAPSTIAVTFPVTVSPNVGNTIQTSKQQAWVGFGLQDDAYNETVDNPFETHNVDYIGVPIGMAVDNTPPSISGKVDVVLLSGSATTILTNGMEQVLGPGQIVPANSIIAPGAVLSVSITVTDGVDHPIDVLNNPNYGLVSLTAKNIALPASNIQIVTEVAKFIVPDSAEVPFTVQIPSAQEGFSTANLFFIIDATDTIGNTASKNSNSTFQYDANPVVAVQMDGTDVTVPGTFIVNAGQGDVVFNAKTFDVGGVTKVEWLVDGTAPEGVTLSEPLFTELATPQRNVDWPVTVTSQILPFGTVLSGDQIVMNAQVTDKDASVTTSGALNVVFNQPSLFAEFFDFAAGAIVDATLEAPENGLNAAGVDVREVTISEGDVLDIVIEAADANGDPVFLVAGGTAFATDAMLDSVSIATGEMAGPTAALQIVPGYLAVTGDAQSATFTVELSASDNQYPAADNVTILVNVLAKSSKPVVTVQSMTVDGVEVPYNGSVIVPEGQTLVAVVQAVDPGQEDLFFSIDAPEYILNGNVSLEESATSYIKTVTMTYTPGMEDADIIDALVPVDNPWDPFIAAMTFSNSNASTTEDVEVDIENVSQPPVATVTYSLNGALPVPIQSGEIIPNVPAGSVIVFYYAATDPDGKLTYLMPGSQGISVTPASFATTFGDRILEIPRIRVEVTVKVPGEVVAGESDAVVTYVAVDQDGSSTTSVFTIQASPTTTPQADEIVFAAGVGGSQVNVKNFDKYNGNLFDLKNAFWGMPPTFLPVAGGGENRETYVSLGDIDANNTPDIVVSFGSVTADTTVEDVTYPNVLYVREKTYDQGVWKYTVIENSAIDPFYGTDPTKPVFYNKGDVKTAIGNFIGAHPNQVVAVQGRGGNGVLRLLQWNGTAWSVKAQFNALEDNVNGANMNALSKNLTGEINIAAADFNGDGIAELVAGQGNSASSETIVQVVQFERTEGVGMAGVANRVEFTAFDAAWQGEGGVKVAAADLNGDGKDELIVSSTGQEDNWTKSIIAIYSPTVVEGMLTGFVKVSGEMGTFSNEVNPSGVINIAAGELDGNATTGQELIVATGALMEADGITPVVTAPVNKFRVVKPQFNGLIYTSYTRVMIDMGAYMANLGQDAGWQVFHGEWAPTSGALNVASGEDIYKAGLVY